jgi:hypothetical protein
MTAIIVKKDRTFLWFFMIFSQFHKSYKEPQFCYGYEASYGEVIAGVKNYYSRWTQEQEIWEKR